MSLTVTKTIVVKVGSSSLVGRGGGLDRKKVSAVAAQMCALQKMGHRTVLVTSGAIAAGFRRLGYTEKPRTVAEKQAAAAVGQGLLMEEYNRTFSRQEVPCGQLLLTRGDFADKRRFDNAFAALRVLMDRGAVPIINENDTVAVEELKIGDNDTLSAQVAAMVHADLLILLTDIDGLYTADPAKDPTARHIDEVSEIDDRLLSMAADTHTGVGTGGMQTKLRCALLATAAGVPVFICSSAEEDAILRAASGTARGTRFLVQHRMHTRQQWLAFYALPSGTLYVDEGAAKALTEGKKSLLPPGIVRVEGDFDVGEVVTVCRADTGKPLGRGIVNYTAETLLQLKGTPGPHGEAIHRDNWASLP